MAAGAIEPRHVYVPLRIMCPDAEHLRGRAVAVDENAKQVTVETDLGPVQVGYERLVVALGSTARMLPIPGLAEHSIPFKGLGDAIHLRGTYTRVCESDRESGLATGDQHRGAGAQSHENSGCNCQRSIGARFEQPKTVDILHRCHGSGLTCPPINQGRQHAILSV